MQRTMSKRFGDVQDSRGKEEVSNEAVSRTLWKKSRNLAMFLLLKEGKRRVGGGEGFK